MTKVPRHYLLRFLSPTSSNPGIPFLAKNKQGKNRFKEGFRIIPKYGRRNSEKHRMQLNNLPLFGKMTKPELNLKNTRNYTQYTRQ